MHIHASVRSTPHSHEVEVRTEDQPSVLAISGRPDGGSATNGGELLCAALATCYCNDVYREAARRGITIHGVTVRVHAAFGARGEPAHDITYSAQVEGDASPAELEALLRETDAVAEVQNTLRAGVTVRLMTAGAPGGDT